MGHRAQNGSLWISALALALCACPRPLTDPCQTKAQCPAGYRCDTELGICALETQADAGAADAASRDSAADAGGAADVGARDGAAFDSAGPDASAADGALPDAFVADSAAADSAAVDASAADAAVPDAAAADAAAADAASPDSAQADAAQADAAGPDAAQADAAGPDAAQADAGGGDGFPDPWHLPAWPRRMRLRFHNTDQGADLSAFPVLVRLTPDHFDYADEVSNGEGLRFVSAGGVVLPHEVERWVRDDASELWVAIPSITARESSSYVYLYFGNSSAPAGSSTEVWPDTYELVLLFKGSSAATALLDSSRQQRGVGGTYSGHMPSKIANGMHLAQEEYVEVPSLDGLGMPQSSGTYSLMVKLSTWTTATADLLDSSAAGERLWMSVASDLLAAEARTAAAPLGTYRVTDSAPSSGWTRVSMVWDGGDRLLTLYREGIRGGIITLPAGWQPTDQAFIIRGTGMNDPDGIIDDVRLSNVARSGTWLSAEWEVVQDNFVVFEPVPTPPQPEVSGGVYAGTPVVLYEFDDASGTTVADTSGYGQPLNLHIADEGSVEWLAGALRIKRATVIESAATADKIGFACATVNAISVEAWVQPDHTLFEGPARIATYSADASAHNFMLGQDLPTDDRQDPRYCLRLRHQDTDPLGRMRVDGRRVFPLSADDPAHHPRPARTHVVFTFDGQQVCSYVDGALHPLGCEPWQGNIANSWDSYLLRLANEKSSSTQAYVRPWLGTLYRVAVYCQTLTDEDVLQNYLAGMGN